MIVFHNFPSFIILFAAVAPIQCSVVPSPQVQAELDVVRDTFVNKFLHAITAPTKVNSQSINLPPIKPRVNEEGLITCPPGYTGPNCEIVYCIATGSVENVDGTQGYGALIETANVANCEGNFTFPIDVYLSRLYLLVTASPDANPTATVSDINGRVYQPDKVEQTDRALLYQFDYLPPSQYNALLHSATSRDCLAVMRGLTLVTVSGGFVANLTSDDPVTNLVENSLNWFVFHVNSEASPAHPTALAVFENNQQISFYPNLNGPDHTRYHCAYEYYAGIVTCTSVSFYVYKIQGVDRDGNVWQRVPDSYPCLPPPFTTGSPGTGSTSNPPPITSCQNGGQLVNMTVPAACYCTPFYTGVQCETSLCFNGGTLSMSDGSCQCAIGYGGQHCEHVQCGTSSGYDFDTSHRALIFIVRSSKSMQTAIQQIYTTALQLGPDYALNHPDYINQFVLTTFGNGSIETTVYRSYGSFANAINHIPTVDAGCDDSVLTAIEATFTSGSFAKAPVFIFTDAAAIDYQQRIAVMNQLSFWRGELYFVVTDPGAGCTLDTAQPGYRVFDELARFSHGLRMHIQPSRITNLVRGIGKYFYKTDTILIDDLNNCNNQLPYQPFFIDSQTSDLIIFATGTSLSLMLTLPNRTVTNPTPVVLQNNTYVWALGLNTLPHEALATGAYFFSFNSTAAPCSYRVKAVTDLQFFFSVSDNINRDTIGPQPVWNSEAHIVAHLNALNISNAMSLFAEATIAANERDVRNVLYATNGIYRDGCDFALYFGKWTCLVPEQIFYLTVYASDSNGRIFQRTLTAFCSASTIPSTPPPGGCGNGGVIQNGNCYCPPLWQGPQCIQIQCLNGGTSLGAVCRCPPGFTSSHCEQVTCYQANLNTNFDVNGRSLTFVIQNSISMKFTIQQISDHAVTLINDIQSQHINWITQYQIVLFDDKSVQIYLNSTTAQDFVVGLHQVYNNLPTSFPPCGPQQTIAALIAALQSATANGYVFVFTDRPALINDSFNALLLLVDQLKPQITFAITNPRPCGDPFLTPQTQIFAQIAELTGGAAFVVTSYLIKDWLQYIPTLYSSGLVYEDYANDCTTQNQTFYFPVDSHTQSITVAVLGYSSTIQLKPPGSSSPYLAIYNLYNEPNLHIVSAVEACEDGWGWDDETHCFLFGITALNWTSARDTCHSFNSALATVFDYKIAQFLREQSPGNDFWIGLNDIAQQGIFVWDSINANTSQQLNSTDYQEWAPNQPSNDSALRCVIEQQKDNEPKGWATIDCSASHFFVCMKHAYVTEFEPDDPNDNPIRPGVWSVTVATTILNDKPQPCAVQVRAQSAIQMYSGFVTTIHDDMVAAEPLIGSRSNMMAVHVSHLVEVEMQTSGSLQYMHIYRENLTIEQVQTYAGRARCSYEYLSTPFHCIDIQFQVLATGIDQYGYLFQRIQPAVCLGGTLGGCANGGFLHDGQCQCASYWTGVNCETAVCVNGGTLLPGGLHCKCLDGYSGNSCQYDTCLPPIPTAFNDGDVSLVLVVDGTPRNNQTVAQMRTFLNLWLSALSNFQSGWFLNYILVVFRDHDTVPIIEPPIVATSISTFVSYFLNATQNLGGNNDCPKNALGGLLAALKSPKLLPNSVVLVLTAAAPYDPYLESQVLDQVALTHAMVSFIISEPTGQGPCGGFTDSSTQTYFHISEMSGGNVYHIDPSSLTSFLSAFTPTLYSSANLVQTISTDCSNITQYIQVDYHTRELTIDIFAINGNSVSFQSVNVTMPNGTRVSSQPVSAGMTSRTFLEILPISQLPGIWTMTLSTPGPCNIQVRGQSAMEAFIAYTHDSNFAHSDSGDITPTQGCTPSLRPRAYFESI